MPKTNRDDLNTGKLILLVLAVLNGVGLLILSYFAFEPLLAGTKAPEKPEEEKLKLPAYDYAAWHALPVQTNGRIMPMESACIDLVRQVTGRAKFEKQDPVAVVLSWMTYRPGGANPSAGFPDWNNYAFILCDHHELRKEIFSKEDLLRGTDAEPTEAQLHGKYLTPNEVRESQTLRRYYLAGDKKRQEDPEKWQHKLEPLERKAREVMERLFVFENHIPLESIPVQASPIRRKADASLDPFRLVLLDKVHGGGWMALGQLRDCLENKHGWTLYWATGLRDPKAASNPLVWQDLMNSTFRRMPHLYLPPYAQEGLQAFQEKLKNGKGQEALDELVPMLEQRNREQIAKLRKLEQEEEPDAAIRYVTEIVPEKDHFNRLRDNFKALPKTQDRKSLADIVGPFLKERNEKILKELRDRVATAQHLYNPVDDKHRDLHMTYLELRFPDLYKDSTAWQDFPREDAIAVESAFDAVEKAYRSGDAAQFAQASQAFAGQVQTVSAKYDPNFPLVTTLNLEMTLNRVEPFRWAWVSMLMAVLLMTLHLGTGWRPLYWATFIPLAISLGFQAFAYYCRCMISGRPPVTNLYETVVFVATMSVVFSLILEAFYRRGYLLLGGMVVGTLGLVLADQLPTTSSFNSVIGPLNPVLRSNYWLTIHVLTIVASYAAGTLAWGLGNIMLAMYLFGSRKQELLKLMANFCYKAMQIAVLLLAAGTFLGGWWAAESWGRFWGWDPKETFALIALIVYVIPLHMRYMGWVKDFGMAVAAVLCYSSIFMSWYGVNFILPAGLHSYGFGSGGTMWAFWAGMLNLEFLFVVWALHLHRQSRVVAATPVRTAEPEMVAATPV